MSTKLHALKNYPFRNASTHTPLRINKLLLLLFVFLLTFTGSILKAQAAGALNFDGTNDYVELQNSASLQSYVTTGELTLEFWIRPEAGQTDYTLISNRIGSNAQGFVMEHYTGLFRAWVRYGNAWIDAPVTLTSGVWQHVAIVANSMSGTETYVNGLLANSTAASGVFSSPNVNMRLGEDIGSPGARIFGGDMDEVRIWNRALCAAEIGAHKDCELAGNEAGLVAYYQFNQGNVGADNSTVTTLTDATANGNDGTLTNFDDLAVGASTSNWTAPGGVTSGTVCGPANLPEITVNDDLANTDFGDVAINTTSDRSFTITNDGTADLDIAGISSSNPLFSVTLPANTTIAAGNNESFTVTFAPSSTGIQSANIAIQSNDCDENPYSFTVTGTGSAALPVDYLSLSATTEKDHIALEWTTENEEENLGFYVERRSETERDFRGIGFVAAAGVADANYTFDDHEVVAGTNYVYRLRQTDLDGTTAYSPLVSARTQDAKEGLKAWPNPTKGLLFVQATSSAPQATLYDATGRSIRTLLLVEGLGKADLSDLSAGVYFLRVGDEVLRIVK